MGRRRGSSTKVKARKAVNVKLLAREHAGQVTGAYRIMDKLIEEHHPHLAKAKIAIAWRYGWKPDADGRLKLGQAKKGSDLDRELHGFDFVILLNHTVYNMGIFTEAQQRALLDHELCHCEISNDKNGEEKTDENGRTVYRIRGHDVEEFREVVARHGVWKDDLKEFVAAAAPDRDRPLLKEVESSTPGPSPSANGRAEVNGTPIASWRDVPIAALNLSNSCQVLTKAGIETLGQMGDYHRANGGLSGLEGMTKKRGEHIAERLQQYWEAHPDHSAQHEEWEKAGVG